MAAKPSAPGNDQRHQVRILVYGLILSGLLATLWHYYSADQQAPVPGDHLWELEIVVDTVAVAGKTVLAVSPPTNTLSLRIIGQSLQHAGWRQLFQQAPETGASRKIRLLATRGGASTATLAFNIHELARPHLGNPPAATALDAAKRETFLNDHFLLQIADPEVVARVARLSANGDTPNLLVREIFQLAASLPRHFGKRTLPVSEILAGAGANAGERAYTMVALCRAALIPARVVRGVVLGGASTGDLHFWMEAHLEGKWVSYDPTFGYLESVPARYLPISKGGVDPVTLTEGELVNISYTAENIDPLLDLPDTSEQGWLDVFDLSRLTLDTRILLATLFLLPFGVLLTAIFTELIGVGAYGVFTPTLLAASLVYVPWESAATIIATVLIVGVIGRSLMPGGLRRALRLSIVITFVAIGVGASASLMDYFSLLFGGQLALLPVVVLVTLVDRFYTQVDERGIRTALYRLGWTLLIAALCLPIVHFEALGHALISNLHWHLFTLAAILALSLYTGKRLAQVRGFTWLGWSERSKT